MKLERQQQVQKVLRTQPTQAVDDQGRSWSGVCVVSSEAGVRGLCSRNLFLFLSPNTGFFARIRVLADCTRKIAKQKNA